MGTALHQTHQPQGPPSPAAVQPGQKAKQILSLQLHREHPEHEDDFCLFGDSPCATSPEDPAMQTCPRADLNGERDTITTRTSGRQASPNCEY